MRESRYNTWVERGDTAYVFNGVSGALLRVSRQDRDALRQLLAGEERSTCPIKLLEYLASGQMLIADDTDELALLKERYRFSCEDSSVFRLTIVTSLGCNFDCPYCFEAKHPSIMDAETQQAVLQVVDDQLPKISSLGVVWYGGEPLVGKKPLMALSDVFIERCERAGVSYSADMATNGYLLDEETCAQLRERRVTRVQVCLDGPPEVHDRMRPQAGGRGSFWKIIENLHQAVCYFKVAIRMNLDQDNNSYAEELLEILAREGFAGKLHVYPAQIVKVNDGVASPSSAYRSCCFAGQEFARAALRFVALATKYGLAGPSLPRPIRTPCTAMRINELVVGSRGELYKCWMSVGNQLEVVGNIRDYRNLNGRLHKWLKYDPFSDDECRNCIALPGCMGGCAHNSMDPHQHENRCGTFRHIYREQVSAFVEAAAQEGSSGRIPSAKLAHHTETRLVSKQRSPVEAMPT